mmetsp:Transcript_75807/g.152329  ORF Transcript_75807/g.152329 Transcript_75807/m.152329 type:complete len:236 (-) Transcript_75807:49-756(-)
MQREIDALLGLFQEETGALLSNLGLGRQSLPSLTNLVRLNEQIQSTGLEEHQSLASELQTLKTEVESVDSRLRNMSRDIVEAEEDLANAIRRAEVLRSTSLSSSLLSCSAEEVVAYSLLIANTTSAPPAWRVHHGLDPLAMPPNPLSREERVPGKTRGDEFLIPSMVNVSWLRDRSLQEPTIPVTEPTGVKQPRPVPDGHRSKRPRVAGTTHVPEVPQAVKLKVAGFSDSEDDSD